VEWVELAPSLSNRCLVFVKFFLKSVLVGVPIGHGKGCLESGKVDARYPLMV
jgi:hypothetical protein